LPDDALTKEIKLTQDLMDLFLNYQIPSDLLSYNGAADASPQHKVQVVQEYVARIYETINAMKQDTLKDLQLQAAAANPFAIPPPPPNPFAMPPPPPPPPQQSSPVFCSAPPPPPVFCSAPPPPSAFFSAPPPPPPSGGAPPPPPPPAPMPSSAPAPPPPPPPSAPAQTVSQPKQPKEPKPDVPAEKESGAVVSEAAGFDFTQIPTKLDQEFERLDKDSALRPTIIKASKSWTKTSKASLLAEPTTTSISGHQRKDERHKAFDLLDALSRSGSLPFEQASFHVVVAATHCFAKSVMDTLIQDNVNPIERLEQSLLIVAKTLQGVPVSELVKADQLARLQATFPHLF
jgi:hypothetical protein